MLRSSSRAVSLPRGPILPIADNAGGTSSSLRSCLAPDGVGNRVRRENEARNVAFRFASEGGLSAFYWIDSPLSYAVIGQMEREEPLKLARMVYGKLGF